MLSQIGNKGFEAHDIVVLHVQFKLIEPAGNTGLLCFYALIVCHMGEDGIIGKIFIVDLHQRLSLDAKGEVGQLWMIFLTYHSPEYGVLGLCIEHHSVEIK